MGAIVGLGRGRHHDRLPGSAGGGAAETKDGVLVLRLMRLGRTSTFDIPHSTFDISKTECRSMSNIEYRMSNIECRSRTPGTVGEMEKNICENHSRNR